MSARPFTKSTQKIMSSPANKAAKIDDKEQACLKQDSIPLNGVSRHLRFKVADEVCVQKYLFSRITHNVSRVERSC